METQGRDGAERARDHDAIDFGDLPDAVNDILQAGVALYRLDRAAADVAFRRALAIDPTCLAAYFCLYKIHAYSGDLDAARAAAEAGIVEAARQAGRDPDWTTWSADDLVLDGPVRFALYTAKALAFVALRRGDGEAARRILDRLAALDPDDGVGARVVDDLARATDVTKP
ncbi:hypothetical protein EYW49_10765 [Siculibacillus lacustris]|uniref:Tetratricopeptide repeat protein n=1 Tax=Siculibacillus lacustris TaxID=1549641 RepID=A0A4V2KTJ9_9HYPH|nr:hypothetical protein [Siculibacillus lacustris]TBW37584.1 hypothetical protein EYW49_10765 [Siculibacillus lacustris]